MAEEFTTLARTTDPETSRWAALLAQHSPGSAEIKSAIVLLLQQRGPLTAFELRDAYAYGIRVGADWPLCQPNTINRRVSDLANAGMLRDTGIRRNTNDGSPAIVWDLVDDAAMRQLAAAATRIRRRGPLAQERARADRLQRERDELVHALEQIDSVIQRPVSSQKWSDLVIALTSVANYVDDTLRDVRLADRDWRANGGR